MNPVWITVISIHSSENIWSNIVINYDFQYSQYVAWGPRPTDFTRCRVSYLVMLCDAFTTAGFTSSLIFFFFSFAFSRWITVPLSCVLGPDLDISHFISHYPVSLSDIIYIH